MHLVNDGLDQGLVHVRRVADYALILAESADADEKMQRSIERVALGVPVHVVSAVTGQGLAALNESFAAGQTAVSVIGSAMGM